MENYLLNLQYYLLAVLIMLVICKIVLRLNIRDCVFIFLVAFLIIVIPSARMIRHVYFIPMICLFVLISIIAIWLSRLNTRIRIGLTVLVLLVYHRTFIIVGGCVISAVRSISMSKKSDGLLAKYVTELYSASGLRLVTNFDKLPSHPTIILANYCRDRMENCACILVPRKLAIMMQLGLR